MCRKREWRLRREKGQYLALEKGGKRHKGGKSGSVEINKRGGREKRESE